MSFSGLDLSALSGHFRGSAQLAGFKRLSADGMLEGLSLKELAQLNHGPLAGSMEA